MPNTAADTELERSVLLVGLPRQGKQLEGQLLPGTQRVGHFPHFAIGPPPEEPNDGKATESRRAESHRCRATARQVVGRKNAVNVF